jgi:hypothetical protein
MELGIPQQLPSMVRLTSRKLVVGTNIENNKLPFLSMLSSSL